MSFDLEEEPRAERIARASGALAGYGGDDKFLLHLRNLSRPAPKGRTASA